MRLYLAASVVNAALSVTLLCPSQSQLVESPVVESPVAESPVAESPLASPVIESAPARAAPTPTDQMKVAAIDRGEAACVPPIAAGSSDRAVAFAEMFVPTRATDHAPWPRLVPALRDVIESKLSEMRGCDRDGVTKPTPGTTWLALDVDSGGNVHHHSFERPEDAKTDLGACIARTVSSWRYPAMECAGYAFRFPLRF